jgi:release factor glutamine methyltransferase
MTIHQAILYGEDLLRSRGVDQPRWNAERLLLLTLKQDRANIYSDLSRPLRPEDEQSYRRYLSKRAEHYPLAYLEGSQEFYGRNFRVNEHVLIPRPETQEIIRAILNLPLPEKPRLLDLGAGSGNIAATLALQLIGAEVFALELSDRALEVLTWNAVPNGVKVVCGNFVAPPFVQKSFDVVASNPPYVEETDWNNLPAETRWEPRIALLTDDLEQTYANLLKSSWNLLKAKGFFVFEIGFGQSERLRKLVSDLEDWTIIEIRKDERGSPRTFVLRKEGLT